MPAHWLLMLALAATEMPAPSPAEIVWVVDDGLCEPETVIELPDHTLLVSNVCDFRTPGNGYLTQLDSRGRVLNLRVVDRLDAPLGMALIGKELLVVDANRIRVLAWPSLVQQKMVDLDTAVANDIAAGPGGEWYVTDTARGQVVQVNAEGQQSVLAGEGRFPGANGIALKGRHLFVGGERLWCLNLDSGDVRVLGPAWLSDIDGIEIEADGTLQVTPVGGPLVRLRDNRILGVWGGKGISSANHGYARAAGLVVIPTGFDNTVVAFRSPRR